MAAKKLILLDQRAEENNDHARRFMVTTPVNAPPRADSPLMEMNAVELMAVRRWAEAAQFDMCQQVEQHARNDKVSRKQFEEIKTAGAVVVAFLADAVKTCDEMLAQSLKDESAATG